MSDSSEISWSDDPNAPEIPPWQYVAEKELFAGIFLQAISYGIVIVLFFQCVIALLDPANRTKGNIKWGLVIHTVAMFLVLTLSTALDLEIKSILYIDDREFPGSEEFLPGPLGYYDVIAVRAINTAVNAMFPLNQWLADGLLLHRCYVIYSMNYWVIAFPCLMYLASIAMGIAFTHLATEPEINDDVLGYIGDSYYSISLALNILLTLLIITRLILLRRNIRRAMGASNRSGGLYTAVVTMLVESCALYVITLLLFSVPWAVGDWVREIFFGILPATQVIAPYLITLRVARRREMASDMVYSGSGKDVSVHSRSQGTKNSNRTLLDEDSMNSVETSNGDPDRAVVGAEDNIQDAPFG